MYLEMGLYANQIERFITIFGRENVKVLIYEEWTKNVLGTLNNIASFLEISQFTPELQIGKYNETMMIKNRKTMNFLRNRIIKSLLKKYIPNHVTESFKTKYFTSKSPKEEISNLTYNELKPYFKEDVLKLEKILRKPLMKTWNL